MARSAEYLRFLELKFGNLSLAAAAYNGGEGRIGRYVANGGGAMPSETRNYVMIVAERSVDQWLTGAVDEVYYTLDEGTDFLAACIEMARLVRIPDLTTPPAESQPWVFSLRRTPRPSLHDHASLLPRPSSAVCWPMNG